MLIPQAAAQPVFTHIPPREIDKALSDLRERKDTRDALRVLAARDEAAPYIRLELLAVTERAQKRDLTEALSEIESRAWDRNKTRFAWWAATRRIDLCAEYLVYCPNNKDATTAIDQLTPVLHAIGAEAANRLEIPFGTPWKGLWLPTEQMRRTRRNEIHLAEDYVTVSGSFGLDGAIIRANRLSQGFNDPTGCFVVVRSELDHPKPPVAMMNEWIGSIVLVNNSYKPRAVTGSLVIADGDIGFQHPHRQDGVIIANGDIRMTKDCPTDGGERCFLAATGNIVLTSRGQGNRMHAGGSVIFDRNPPNWDSISQKQKELPFGIRFVDPARDFGVELAAQAGGLLVKSVVPESLFARHDVQVGDVITAIDDVPPKTIADFRRQLRRGIIMESVVLHIQRGNQELVRIVFLDGITLPLAPLPREVKR